MAKTKSVYICTNCGADSPKWIGKCPICGEWNSYVCSLYGIKEAHTCGVSYNERDLKAAMKHFAKYLRGADRAAFNKFMQSEAEM